MNGMRGQSYCLYNPGIFFWFYVLLAFPYHPNKKLAVVAYRGEGMERKKLAEHLPVQHEPYTCIDFKASVWSSSPAVHSCCAVTSCARQHAVPADAHGAVRACPAASETPGIHGSAARGTSSTSLPFPAMYAWRTLPPQRQGWGMQTSLIPPSGC